MPDIRSFHFKTWQDEFDKHATEGTKKAFEKAEERFKSEIGINYFSSYQSFKSSNTRRNKKKRGLK